MAAAPPPNRTPALVVTARLIRNLSEQEKVFKSLYDLKPIVSGGTEIHIENVADALNPLCAFGDYKKLVLTGLYDVEPDHMEGIVETWRQLVEECPTAKGSMFALQWECNLAKPASFESANSMHNIRVWANNLIWTSNLEDYEKADAYLTKAIQIARKGQRPDQYVDFTNSLRTGPIEQRYKGSERLEKLQQLKQMWDPNGVFSSTFL